MTANGVWQPQINGTDWDEAAAVALQSDGKIIMVGTMNFNTGVQWNPDIPTQWTDNAHLLPYIMRLNTDGSLDTSFGVGGFNNVDWPGLGNFDSESLDVKVLADDSILMPFIWFHGPAGSGAGKNGVAKFTKDGILDAAFGTGGVVEIVRPQGPYIDICKVAVLSNGDIILAGNQNAPFASPHIFHLNADGSFSNVWTNYQPGKDDVTFKDSILRSLFVQSDDKILIGLIYNSLEYPPKQQWGIARCNSDGTADTGFNSYHGLVTIDPPEFGEASPYAGILQEAGGKLVVGGWMSTIHDDYTTGNFNNASTALVRLNLSDGSLDTSFGQHSGQTYQHMGPNVFDQAASGSMFYDTNGKIVIWGTSGTEGPGPGFHVPNFLLMVCRYTADGLPDVTLNGTGCLLVDMNGQGAADNQTCYGALCQPDGKYVVCGHTGSAVNHGAGHVPGSKCWVLRTSSQGVLDTSFGLTFSYSGAVVATARPANPVGLTTATLNASVTPNSDETFYCFQYGGITGKYTEQTATVSAGSGGGAVPVSANLTGLTTGRTYYSRVVAWSQLGGITLGSEISFSPGVVQTKRNTVSLGIGVGL